MDFVDEWYEDKDLHLLKKLTLIIPTHNRNYYLSRCLWYHAHFPFGQIIVADSSSEEKKSVNRETVAKIIEKFGADILYLEYEPETDKFGGDIYQKWGDAVQHAGMEYSQICTDKEFLMPTVICENIQVLIENDDYVVAHSNDCNIYNKDVYNSLSEYWLEYIRPGKVSELSDDPVERFNHSINYVNPYANSTLLSLTRTNIIRDIYEISNTYGLDLRYGEVFLGYASYLYGKVCYKENILCSRLRDEILIKLDLDKQFDCKSSESSTTRYPFYNDYKRMGVIDRVYNPFISALKTCFKDNTSMSDIEIEKCLNESKHKLKSHLLDNTRTWSLLSYKIGFMSPIWYSSPIKVKVLINKFLKKIISFELPLNEHGIPIRYPEEKIVEKIIKSSIDYHNDDRVYIP